MSALGQKRTFAVQTAHVRFAPKRKLIKFRAYCIEIAHRSFGFYLALD